MSPSFNDLSRKFPETRSAGRPRMLSAEQERQLLADPRADPETKRVVKRRIANRGSAKRVRQKHADEGKQLLEQLQSKCDQLESENDVLKEQVRQRFIFLGGLQKLHLLNTALEEAIKCNAGPQPPKTVGPNEIAPYVPPRSSTPPPQAESDQAAIRALFDEWSNF